MDKNLTDYARPIEVVAGSGPTSAPVVGDPVYRTGGANAVATFLTVPVTVTSVTVTLWEWDGAGWFKGEQVTHNGINGNAVYNWIVGSRKGVTFQISALTGSGTVGVAVQGVTV